MYGNCFHRACKRFNCLPLCSALSQIARTDLCAEHAVSSKFMRTRFCVTFHVRDAQTLWAKQSESKMKIVRFECNCCVLCYYSNFNIYSDGSLGHSCVCDCVCVPCISTNTKLQRIIHLITTENCLLCSPYKRVCVCVVVPEAAVYVRFYTRANPSWRWRHEIDYFLRQCD